MSSGRTLLVLELARTTIFFFNFLNFADSTISFVTYEAVLQCLNFIHLLLWSSYLASLAALIAPMHREILQSLFRRYHVPVLF